MATRTIAPRNTRPVVPIRNQADAALLENAVAFAGLVQAAMAAAPSGSLGDPTAVMDAVAEPTPAPRLLALAGGAR
ncbi:hypothetical protein [Streptomyces decoyicus]